MAKEFKDIFKGMSSDDLRRLSREALHLAEDLEKEEPNYSLALQNGVEDNGYSTVSNGWVDSYSGSAIIKMGNGTIWKAIGHSPMGTGWAVTRNGYIEFIKIP